MDNYRFALIIPAAGAGTRTGADIPKPFIRIGGKTILEHTISRFTGFDSLVQIVISTSLENKETAEAVRPVIPKQISLNVIEGGAERQDSIFNAIQIVDKDVELIAVHDAVRPFVTSKSICSCLEAAVNFGAAIPGIPLRDTIKKVTSENRIVETPERRFLRQAQTPQVFRSEIIRKAYLYARDHNFSGTDDASLIEYLGEKVVMVEGSRDNFKITYPLDLKLAELLIKKQQNNQD